MSHPPASRDKQMLESSPEDAGVIMVKQTPRQYGDTYAAGYAHVHNGDHVHYHQATSPPGSELQQMLVSLFSANMHRRYEQLREAQHGTYEWILSPCPEDEISADPQFNSRRQCMASFFQWLETGDHLYWISGKPGSGKSTLMKFLAENINSRSASPTPNGQVILSFFFWVGDDAIQRSKLGCLRSLLWQLLQNSVSQPIAMHECRPHAQSAWTEQRLQLVLLVILKRLDISIIIFVDGLDESLDPDGLLNFFGTLCMIENVKICVSSRPEPVFIAILSGSPCLKLHNLNRKDIQRVINEKLLRDARVCALGIDSVLHHGQPIAEALAEQLLYKSRGIFLWVHLVVKDLLKGLSNKDDLKMLMHRLDRLPSDISELYQDMLRRNRDDLPLYERDTSLYFALVLHRKFSLLEFCFAINDDLRRKYLQPLIFNGQARLCTDIRDEEVETWINARTAGLLEVVGHAYGHLQSTSDTKIDQSNISLKHKEWRLLVRTRNRAVDFVHRTARDFLQNTTPGSSMLDSSTNTTEQIARICFQTLLIHRLVLPGLQGHHTLPDRAVSVFSCHRCKDVDISAELGDQAQNILQSLSDFGLVLTDKEYVSTPKHLMREILCADVMKTCGPWLSPRGYLFPCSRYATIDLVPILLYTGRYTLARLWLVKRGCTNDSQYLSTLLAPTIYRLNDSMPENEEGVYACLEYLVRQGTAIFSTIEIQGGETISILQEVTEAVHYIRRRVSSTRGLMDILKLTDEDIVARSAGCCYSYASIWYVSWSEHLSYEVWGSFYAAAGDSLDFQPRNAVVVDTNRQASLRVVSEADTHRLISSSATLYYPQVLDAGRLMLNIKPGLQWGKTPVQETHRCSTVISFAEAMRRLGKSEEVIRTFYENESRRMTLGPPHSRWGWEEWYWGPEGAPPLTVETRLVENPVSSIGARECDDTRAIKSKDL